MTNITKPANDAYKARAANAIEKAFSCEQRGYRNSPMHEILERKMQAKLSELQAPGHVEKLRTEYIATYRKLKAIEKKLKQFGWEIDDCSDVFKMTLNNDTEKQKVWSECLAQAKNDKRKLIEAVYAATTIAEVTEAVEKAETYH